MAVSAPTILTARRRQEIVLTRVFDAPRRLVFNAMTLPEMLGHWFGPADASLEVCEVELHRGGAFRYVWRTAAGEETRVSGTFLEVTAPQRIVAIERFEIGGRSMEFVSTTELVESDGLTSLTRTIRTAAGGSRSERKLGPVEREVTFGYDRLGDLFDPAAISSR